MGDSLDKVLRHSALLALAGERYFERGEGYYRDGRVRDLVQHEGVLVAKVVGTHEYRVKLWSEGEDLRYSCNCPLGVDEEFCKHCVAVGLEFLYGKRSEEPAEVMGRLRSYLEGQEKEELIRLLLDHASEDEVLRERLSMTAAGEGPDAPDINAFRQVIDRAFDPGDFMEPYPDYIRGIENVVESLSGLLGRGFAAETVELAEYALRTAEDAMDYDVDGYMIGVLHDLEDIDHAACKEANPDPETLARRLFEWELRGDYDTFFEAARTYEDVLGERGLAVYRELAEREWQRLSGNESSGERFRIKHIMEVLARQRGDVEARVSVESRDLSSARAYLKIAEIYKEAGDEDRAIEWAERGVREAEDTDSRLRSFLAKEYQRRGRHPEAMKLIWSNFTEAPRLEGYQELKAHAVWASRWAEYRERALALLREDIARTRREFRLPVDRSRLVEVLLWEGRDEEAWREAQEGGCSAELWLELASRREKDHPDDAIAVYQSQVEQAIDRKNRKAYKEARRLLVKVRDLMRETGREEEFSFYLESIRNKHARKRALMEVLKSL